MSDERGTRKAFGQLSGRLRNAIQASTEITITCRLVGLSMVEHVNFDEFESSGQFVTWEAADTIAIRLGISREAVLKARKAMIDAGVIKRLSDVKKIGRGQTMRYVFTKRWLDAAGSKIAERIAKARHERVSTRTPFTPKRVSAGTSFTPERVSRKTEKGVQGDAKRVYGKAQKGVSRDTRTYKEPTTELTTNLQGALRAPVADDALASPPGGSRVAAPSPDLTDDEVIALVSTVLHASRPAARKLLSLGPPFLDRSEREALGHRDSARDAVERLAARHRSAEAAAARGDQWGVDWMAVFKSEAA